MKILNYFLIVTLLVILPIIKVNSQNQSEMISLSLSCYKKNDKNLNFVYNKILNNFKKDKIFIVKLKESQINWHKYKDSAFDTLFYKSDEEIINYGSNYGIYTNWYLSELTKERISQLKRLVQLRCLYREDKYIKGECSNNTIEKIFKGYL